MNLNPLFLNKLNSANNGQAISFPKLESQQFLFSNIIQVYEEDLEIPQAVQNLITEEKPDLLISELSQILSSFDGNQNIATSENQSEIPLLVNEKEIVGKEFNFDKATVKELINKIRELLDVNKNFSIEVKKIQLNVDGENSKPIKEESLNLEGTKIKYVSTSAEAEKLISPFEGSISKKVETVPDDSLSKENSVFDKSCNKEIPSEVNSEPDYSFEIKIKTESKEVLVTIIPTNVIKTIPNKNSEASSVVTIENSETSGAVPVANSETNRAKKFGNSGTGSSLLPESSAFSKSGVVNENVGLVKSSEQVLSKSKSSVLNPVPVSEFSNSNEQNIDLDAQILNQNDSLQTNSVKGDSELTENVSIKASVIVEDKNDIYVEAPLKQSKQSPIELTVPNKHFSVKVQESGENVNLTPNQKGTEIIKTEPFLEKTTPTAIKQFSNESGIEGSIPVQEGLSKQFAQNTELDVETVTPSIMKSEVDVENKTVKLEPLKSTISPDSEPVVKVKTTVTKVAQPNSIIEVEPKSNGIFDKSSMEVNQPESVNIPDSKVVIEKVGFSNEVESKEEKTINKDVAQTKATNGVVISEKPEGAANTKETVKPETLITTKETVRAETPAPVKEALKAETLATTKETLNEAKKTETPGPVKEAVKPETSAPEHKENIQINKISDPISTEKVKYSKEVDDSIPVEKNLPSVKKAQTEEIKIISEDKDYKVKIEVKNNSEIIASKIENIVTTPAKELEVFEISGMMKSIKSESNKDIKIEETVKVGKENTTTDAKKVTESEAKSDTGSKNEFSDKNLQQFTKSQTIDRVEAPKDKIFSELHNMQDNIRLIKSNEIVKEINKVFARPEAQSMTFQITPDELGKVKLVIDLIENRVSAKIEVESEQVRQIVQNNIEQLKSSIQSSGVQVSSLNVSLNYNEQKAGKNSLSKKKNSTNENKFEIEDAKDDNSRKKMGYSTVEFLA
ncbi:MAG: flagellar hook-length control protein FliK [Melioribacteraceae bacterium]